MTNDILNSIVSKHLGKAGDGTVVKPYVTPNVHDRSLLVPVPRKLNRTQYGIDENNLPFVGADLWNSYEISFMLKSGYPISGIGKLIYPADSPNIVESKSLKLYFNSFNMDPLGDTIKEAISKFESIVVEDLSAAVGAKVKFNFLCPIGAGKHSVSNYDEGNHIDVLILDALRIENMVNVSKMRFEHFTETPDLLQKVPAANAKVAQFITTNALRSNCRVTNQPDWGDVFVYIKGNENINEASFLKYIVSMRRENHFHEEICEAIYKRLFDLFDKKTDIMVACLYTRRGGIDINPVRASSSKVLDIADAIYNTKYFPFKTLRQ